MDKFIGIKVHSTNVGYPVDGEYYDKIFESGGVKTMVIFITGASHTGKTVLAQKLLEKCNYPYISIDHLKMGLIRSGYTDLTPMSDDGELTEYLWPVVCGIAKTAIENRQNLIIEGCYIPFNWQDSFEKEYIDNIKYCLLVMSEEYIKSHFSEIKKYASVIESRIDDEWCTLESVLRDNAKMLKNAIKHKLDYMLIDGKYMEWINSACDNI